MIATMQFLTATLGELKRLESIVPSRLLFLCLSVCVLTTLSLARESSEAKVQIQGTAFVQNSTGQSCIANAKVTLEGPTVTMGTETDESGKFQFRNVRPGTYTIKVSMPGLEATQVVTVEMGKVTQISVELKPTEVRESVIVTATANDGPSPSPSPSGTVTSSTLHNAPNMDDRTESVLPTLPGVVRGPDGRINLKGARTTQSGALVNSANATDPATGGPGISVPIDVVASESVISNPYDPEYGKLTGAVSTVDTNTSDFEKFHFSIHNFLPRARVGLAVFNLFNHFNPRDVQTIEQSSRFGAFFNNAWREYRGKFTVEF